MSEKLHTNHYAEAERYLSQASWFRGTGPDAEPVNPQAAAVLASLAQAHATLAALPEQTVAVQEALREVRMELSVMRRVVAETIGEALFDGSPAAKRFAWGLAYSLECRRVPIADAAKERIASLGGDPEALWADPDDDLVLRGPAASLFEVAGVSYNLARTYRDRNGVEWMHSGHWAGDGAPVFMTTQGAERRVCPLPSVVKAAGPLTPVTDQASF
jgi:hypothetical protein